MELSQMIQFKAVVECENISRAAEKLFLSQPAVSKSLHKIEEELGIKLFLRSGNRLILQPEGRIVLAHVNRVMEELDAMKAQLNHSDTGKKVIRVASPCSAILRYYVTGFIDNRPDIIVPSTLREQDELERILVNGEVDVVFTVRPFQNPCVCNMLFDEETLMVSVPIKHPLAALDHVHLKDLEGQTILMKPSLGLLHKRQDEVIAREKITLNMIRQEDYLIYREVARTSSLAYFTSSIASHFYEPSSHARKLIPVMDPEVHLTYYVALRVDGLADSLPFIDWIFKNRICQQSM